MAFRLPTHLESLVPPPVAQRPEHKPWRGTFTLMPNGSATTASQVLYATAAETEGDNRTELWPANFFIQHMYPTIELQEIQSWVKRHSVPLCMFMPDRLPYSNDSKANEGGFRSLARFLSENKMIAVAPWNAPDRFSGAGILLFPTQASSGLLVGAIFLQTGFPPFVGSTPTSPPYTRAQAYTPIPAQGSPYPPGPSMGPLLTPQIPSIHSAFPHDASGQGSVPGFPYVTPDLADQIAPTTYASSSSNVGGPSWSPTHTGQNPNFNNQRNG